MSIERKRRLRVFGWSGHRPEAYGKDGNHEHHGQTREICAARSMAAVARAAGVKHRARLWNLGVTGNKHEIEEAMKHPDRVLWRALNARSEPYNWTLAPEPVGLAKSLQGVRESAEQSCSEEGT